MKKMRTNLAALGLVTAVTLSSCSKSVAPNAHISLAEPPSVLSSEGVLTLKGNLNGQTLSGSVGSLTVGPNALKGEATVTVT